MKVIALDLEGTLISNGVSQIVRPGLYDFLEECHTLCGRVVIFTTVEEKIFFQIAATLVAEEAAPEWFKCIEYIHWSGAIKDLDFIKDVDASEVVLIDDCAEYIHPMQISQWIEIQQFSHPYSDEDNQLKLVLQKLKSYTEP